MKYELFVTLFKEALEYDSEEIYIAERGWQDWMNQYENSKKIAFILKSIYYYVTHDLRKIREDRELSRAKFSRSYGIPLRTVEDWEYKENKISNYDKMFICYTFFIDDLLK